MVPSAIDGMRITFILFVTCHTAKCVPPPERANAISQVLLISRVMTRSGQEEDTKARPAPHGSME